MRLSWGLALGVIALGAQATKQLQARQNLLTSGFQQITSMVPITPTTTSNNNNAITTTTGAGDTTITVTSTVTNTGGGNTVTSTTTIQVRTVTTITLTTTAISTTTVTDNSGDTATTTIYVTSTQMVNAKRDLDSQVEVRDALPAHVEARETPAARLPLVVREVSDGVPRARNLEKRAVVTNTVFVTVGGDGEGSTVTATATQSIISTATSAVGTTSVITQTAHPNAKTTTSITSTIVVRQTQVTPGAVQTSNSAPDSSGGGGGGGGGSSGGLSTGAKAGIGAGVGVAVLVVLGGLILFCLKRRRDPKPDPDDLLGPSSEVPVGSAGGSHGYRPMSEGLAAAPGAAPRRNPVLPDVRPEGYRGTAMGDGRAGYAKPETYGAAYSPSRSNTANTRSSTLAPNDQLPRHPTPETATSVSPLSARPATAELGHDGSGAKWHSSGAAEMGTDNATAAKWHSDNAHEIDSQPAKNQQSGPVYEMP